MGYFLLRESMLDSLVRARDIFLKPSTGLMMPSHATMLVAPITDEEERKVQSSEYAHAMEDWKEFAETTQTMYGVDMSVLEKDFDREQREYYVLSSRWAELQNGCLLAAPCVVKEYDMHVCTVEDARGVGLAAGKDEGVGVPFDFDIAGRSANAVENADAAGGAVGPISGFAGWFTVDFKSRTDEVGRGAAPEVPNPAYLSTGPEMGCECSFYSVLQPFSTNASMSSYILNNPMPPPFLHYYLQTPTGANRCSTCRPPSPSLPTRRRASTGRWR